MTGAAFAPLEQARRAAAAIAPLAREIEAARRLPPPAVAALVEAGVFKLLVPRRFGGAEADVATVLEIIEILARADGSAGWCAMIGATSALMCGHLDDDTARAVYGPPDAVTCGVFAPMGRATPEGDGFRVSGRWPFASGCEHSQWRMGGAVVAGAGDRSPNGQPDVRSLLFAAAETRVLPTWDASGLRGTGSHDLEVADVFVPRERSFSLLTDRPKQEGAVYAMPFFGVLAAGVAAVTLGIARAAIDALVALARVKHPLGARRSLAEREGVQLAVARAEADVGAARAFLFEALGRAAGEAARGGASVESRARLRLAACHAARACAAAVDLMYEAGGATSIYADHPLQRCFRDVHVATQHVLVGPTAAALAGRLLLGLESDVATL